MRIFLNKCFICVLLVITFAGNGVCADSRLQDRIQSLNHEYRIGMHDRLKWRILKPFSRPESLLTEYREKYDSDYDAILGIEPFAITNQRDSAWDKAVSKAARQRARFLFIAALIWIPNVMFVEMAWDYYRENMLELAIELERSISSNPLQVY